MYRIEYAIPPRRGPNARSPPNYTPHRGTWLSSLIKCYSRRRQMPTPFCLRLDLPPQPLLPPSAPPTLSLFIRLRRGTLRPSPHHPPRATVPLAHLPVAAALSQCTARSLRHSQCALSCRIRCDSAATATTTATPAATPTAAAAASARRAALLTALSPLPLRPRLHGGCVVPPGTKLLAGHEVLPRPLRGLHEVLLRVLVARDVTHLVRGRGGGRVGGRVRSRVGVGVGVRGRVGIRVGFGAGLGYPSPPTSRHRGSGRAPAQPSGGMPSRQAGAAVRGAAARGGTTP